MDQPEFERGASDGLADIDAGRCRFFFQTRGEWGRLFVQLMRDRFSVDVVHISDITSDRQHSYECGYNNAIEGHLDRKFGAGQFDRTWQEVQEFRQETYRRAFGPPNNS